MYEEARQVYEYVGAAAIQSFQFSENMPSRFLWSLDWPPFAGKRDAAADWLAEVCEEGVAQGGKTPLTTSTHHQRESLTHLLHIVQCSSTRPVLHRIFSTPLNESELPVSVSHGLVARGYCTRLSLVPSR